MWNVTWPATNASTIARQKCPGSSEAQGKTVSYRVIGYFSPISMFFLVIVNHSLISCKPLDIQWRRKQNIVGGLKPYYIVG